MKRKLIIFWLLTLILIGGYLVKKDKDDAENDIFRATVWPGPYNFATTPDDQKISATFPFTEEGKQQAVDWMNEQWRSRSEWGIIMHS